MDPNCRIVASNFKQQNEKVYWGLRAPSNKMRNHFHQKKKIFDKTNLFYVKGWLRYGISHFYAKF